VKINEEEFGELEELSPLSVEPVPENATYAGGGGGTKSSDRQSFSCTSRPALRPSAGISSKR
jgi:hypothetical protein